MRMGNSGKPPFFSVIVPVYNQPKLVLRALGSLQQQEFADWECWIVDDGSTDETSAVLQQWVAKESRCFLLTSSENRGAAAARNMALPYVRGAFVTFLDADDWYLPTHLRIRWQYIQLFPEIPWFYGSIRLLGSPYVPDVHAPWRRIHLQQCVIGATFVIRRQVLLRLGGFPEVRYGEDYWLFRQARRLRIAQYHIPHRTYVYDRTHSQVTRWKLSRPEA